MMKELGHRERFLRAVDHKDIDRVPIYYRAETQVNDKMKQYLDLKDDNDILSYFDVDTMFIKVCRKKQHLGKKEREDGCTYDIFGNKIKTVHNGAYSTRAVVEPVLAGSENIEDIYTRIQWPDSSIINIEESLKVAQAARATGRAVYGGMWASLFTESRSIMGEENFLLATIDNQEFVTGLIERLTDFYIESNEVYFNACAKYIDVFYFGSDFGTQTSMFISKEAFCKFFKSGIKKLTQQAKNFGLKVMYHTCGAVSSIIPDLIECGIDILDPVQVSAADMEPEKLVQKFKGKIVFHGGISSQKTLPFGTADEVRQEVENAIKTFGPSGYIVSPDQDMIGDIPAENIEIMFKTAREYKV